MNAWQLVQQLRYLLALWAWPSGVAELVFGPKGVYITAGAAEEAVGRVRPPCVLIRVTESEADDESPSLRKQSFELTLVCVHQGDPMGEFAIIGGHRSSGVGSSKGRGLLELEEQMFAAIELLNQTNDLLLKSTYMSAAQAEQLPGYGTVAVRQYTFEAVLLRDSYYPGPLTFGGSVVGPALNFSWTIPPDLTGRFDWYGAWIRRVSGNVAAASILPTSGVSIAVAVPGTDLTGSDSPGVGTWTYGLFLGYKPLGETNPSHFNSLCISILVTF